jgi:hypothetical protein
MTLDEVKRIIPRVFSNSYFEAREKFLIGATPARAYWCSAAGPSGQRLATDVRYFGSEDAEQLLILVSGTHGVEGYCGSAAQLLLMNSDLVKALPSSTAILCIHALNCYGFAWDRRVTAEGCDLNRNFIDFEEPLLANAEYDELADYLVPSDLTEDAFREADGELAKYKLANGELAYREAVISGQHTRPGGMFFGGVAPTRSRQILEQIAEDFGVANRRRVIVIDYHTGLGPYGYGELQSEHSSGLEGYDRAVSIFGPSVTSPALGTSTSVVIPGSQSAHWERLLGKRQTYVVLEFGTYDVQSALDLLRKDHCLFQHRPELADAEVGRSIRAATKLHFYPIGEDWKEMVLCRAHLVHRQAIAALTEGFARSCVVSQ